MARTEASGAKGALQAMLDSEDGMYSDMVSARQKSGRILAGILCTDLDDEQYDDATVASILLTTINGDAALKDQTVEVEYLSDSKKLVLPAILGINPVNPALTIGPHVPELVARYWKLSTVPFDTMRDWADSKETAKNIQAAVDNLNVVPGREMFTAWPEVGADGMYVDKRLVNVIYMYVCKSLGMNADVRDFFALSWPEMTCADTDWSRVDTFTKARFDPKLKIYTLTQIAGLNYDPCDKFSLGAWARAYGVSCGLMPDSTSRTMVEYVWTTTKAKNDHMRANSVFEKNCGADLRTLSLNILSMFGLLHLNKDHTFRTGDADMERIGNSWLATLRLCTSQQLQEQIMAHKEVISRTAPHPFGLAQTYFCAQLLSRTVGMSPALLLRVGTSPPPVQRVMICDAAKRGWATLPAGGAVNATYASFVAQIEHGVAAIRECPPAYSALYRLYGLDQKLELSHLVKTAVEALIPIVTGYAEAVHGGDRHDGKAQGIALAQSLRNVKRENAAIVAVWTNMWNKYMDSMDKEGIMAFAKEAQATYAAQAAQGTMV